MAEYDPANRQAAAEKQQRAAALQQEASAAAQNAESYVRNTLFFASALFFIGMSRMFSNSRVRLALEVLAGILLLIGIYNALTVPIA